MSSACPGGSVRGGGTAAAAPGGLTAGQAGGWPPPHPGSAPRARMIAAQAGLELRILARNGEQLLLTLIIPVALLAGFSLEPLIKTGSGPRIDFLVPGILALAVMSTAFTSQAIATGFERRYGVLKRLGSTPLGRDGLIAAKTVAVLVVELGQTVIILAVGVALGWRPDCAAGSGGLGPAPAAGGHRGVQRAGPAAGRAPCGRRPPWPRRT